MKVFRRFVYLGAYGGTTKKPTYIYSNSKRLLSTFNKNTVSVPKVITSTVVIKDGRRHVTGTKQLKSTQQYPEEFGSAVAEALQAMDVDEVVSNSGSEARLLMLVVVSPHAFMMLQGRFHQEHLAERNPCFCSCWWAGH